MSTPLDIAEQLFKAIEAGDIDAVRALYAPDIVVWHNNDGIEQPGDDNLRVLQWVIANLADRRYEVVRRAAIEGGFVQQHVLHAVAPSGDPIAMPACMVGLVADGRITRLDEYLDSAHLAPLLAPRRS